MPNKSVAMDPALSYCLRVRVSARRAIELCVIPLSHAFTAANI